MDYVFLMFDKLNQKVGYRLKFASLHHDYQMIDRKYLKKR